MTPRLVKALSSSAYRKSVAESRQPKNRIDSPIGAPRSFRSARSCRKPRNGAIPVPAPTMIIGMCGFSGGRNGMVGLRTNVNTVLPSMLASR